MNNERPIELRLTESEYWRLNSALQAAEAACLRHDMNRHAREYHWVAKMLFRSYEQSMGTWDEDWRARGDYQ